MKPDMLTDEELALLRANWEALIAYGRKAFPPREKGLTWLDDRGPSHYRVERLPSESPETSSAPASPPSSASESPQPPTSPS